MAHGAAGNRGILRPLHEWKRKRRANVWGLIPRLVVTVTREPAQRAGPQAPR
jgi:hypothetical protein